MVFLKKIQNYSRRYLQVLNNDACNSLARLKYIQVLYLEPFLTIFSVLFAEILPRTCLKVHFVYYHS